MNAKRVREEETLGVAKEEEKIFFSGSIYSIPPRLSISLG
jgi:hypothetical protein